MHPPARDRDHVLAHTTGVWDELRDARIFITGGTGFFGCWLLESWRWASERMDMNASITVLTRSVDAFRRKAPHLGSHWSIRLVEGDVRSFRLPSARYTHVIHMASDATPQLCMEQPLLVLDTIVDGTRRVLDLAVESGAKRLLFASSGAVYGPQPAGMSHIPETYTGGPNLVEQRNVYAEAKRTAEMLCTAYGRQFDLRCVPARCFAFAGPYLPLDAHFAFGNFVRDRSDGRPVRVNGDGTAVRSYLYAADLAIWLWTLLVAGVPGRPYNVGAERAVSIAELARMVAGDGAVEIAGTPSTGGLPERYVPSCERARSELNLTERIPLEEAICRTMPVRQAKEEMS
jgi:nucleoside-diphosphate-sugar epimerase